MDSFVLNGIDGSTGQYLHPPMSLDAIADSILGDVIPDPVRASLKHRKQTSRGIKEGDPNDLGQAGWAVVFAQDDPDAEAIRGALSDLLALREQQCGRPVRVLMGEDGYRKGETKRAFLSRVGAEVSGPADPEMFPYYVMLVGSPTDIPFGFQYLLDVQYAVGRLDFDDLDDYREYASSVVRAEEGEVTRARTVGLFGTSNEGDQATELSLAHLIKPMVSRIESVAALEKRFGDAATKDALTTLLTGPARQALLFTATHGVGLPAGHPDQRRDQGALVCQDWPGPKAASRQVREQYFSGVDLDALAGDADLHGMMSFHFACYGAGTPDRDDFAALEWREATPGYSPEPFISSLPKRLLAHPGGGALAAIGHVERQWSHSFRWTVGSEGYRGEGRQLNYLSAMLKQLLAGERVGAAMEVVNQRFAEVATDWSEAQDEAKATLSAGGEVDKAALTALWMAKNDARNMVVIGDPAARIPLG